MVVATVVSWLLSGGRSGLVDVGSWRSGFVMLLSPYRYDSHSVCGISKERAQKSRQVARFSHRSSPAIHTQPGGEPNAIRGIKRHLVDGNWLHSESPDGGEAPDLTRRLPAGLAVVRRLHGRETPTHRPTARCISTLQWLKSAVRSLDRFSSSTPSTSPGRVSLWWHSLRCSGVPTSARTAR